MRNNDHSSLSDALQSFLRQNKLEAGVDRVRVHDAWIALMGNGVANYTTRVDLQGTTLYVSLSSSVLRQELSLGKTKIIAMLNEELGSSLISKLILR